MGYPKYPIFETAVQGFFCNEYCGTKLSIWEKTKTDVELTCTEYLMGSSPVYELHMGERKVTHFSIELTLNNVC